MDIEQLTKKWKEIKDQGREPVFYTEEQVARMVHVLFEILNGKQEPPNEIRGLRVCPFCKRPLSGRVGQETQSENNQEQLRSTG